MSLKNEPVSVEIESCAPSYEQGTPVGLFIIRSLSLQVHGDAGAELDDALRSSAANLDQVAGL